MCTSLVCLLSDIPVSSADFAIYNPGIGTLSLYGFISPGENSAFAHFAAALANHNNLAFLFHEVPITTWGQKQHGMRSLPDTSTYGR